MTEKKLFPGVTQEYVDKKECEEQARIAQGVANEVQRKAKEADEQRNNQINQMLRYAPDTKFGKEARSLNNKAYKLQDSRTLNAVLSGGALLIPFFCFLVSLVLFLGDKKSSGDKGRAFKACFVPGGNAKNPEFIDYVFPGVNWMCLATALVFICFSIGQSVQMGMLKKRACLADKKDSRLKYDVACLMSDLRDSAGNINLNTEQVKRLIELAPEIVQHISREGRVYFDLLLEGKIDIKDNKTFFDMAVAVMKGHLASHPEDAKRVLVVFNEKSIPADLLAQCKQYLR